MPDPIILEQHSHINERSAFDGIIFRIKTYSVDVFNIRQLYRVTLNTMCVIASKMPEGEKVDTGGAGQHQPGAATIFPHSSQESY